MELILQVAAGVLLGQMVHTIVMTIYVRLVAMRRRTGHVEEREALNQALARILGDQGEGAQGTDEEDARDTQNVQESHPSGYR